MSEAEKIRASGTAIAGGAIASAVLEALFAKGILSLDESRAVLDRALRSVAPHVHTPEGLEAAQIIGSLQHGRFAAHGHHE
jgi:hypothetical protein